MGKANNGSATKEEVTNGHSNDLIKGYSHGPVLNRTANNTLLENGLYSSPINGLTKSSSTRSNNGATKDFVDYSTKDFISESSKGFSLPISDAGVTGGVVTALGTGLKLLAVLPIGLIYMLESGIKTLIPRRLRIRYCATVMLEKLCK